MDGKNVLNSGATSLVTGGLGGLGLLACHELVLAGRSRVMAVSRSGRPAPGQHSDAVVEAIQEVSSLEGFRADVSDSSTLLDLYSYACVIDVEQKEQYGQKFEDEMEIQRLIALHGEAKEPQIRKLAKMDYYTFFCGLTDVYDQALQMGVNLGPQRIKKAQGYMDQLAKKLQEMATGPHSDDATFVRMRFQEKLDMFKQIIEQLNLKALAPSEDAMPEAGQALGIPDQYINGPANGTVAPMKNTKLLGVEESVLCRMEKEMVPVAPVVVSCPEGGHPLVLSASKGLWICDKCEGEFRTNKMQCYTCKPCRYFLCGPCLGEARQAAAKEAKRKAHEEMERKAAEEKNA